MSDGIKAALAERGYTVSPIRGSWLAYKTIAGAPDCESNKKPPQLVAEPWPNDPERYVVSCRGSAGSVWYDARAYHVLEEELLSALPEIERRLAAHDSWIFDRNPRDEELTPVEGIGPQPDHCGRFIVCRYDGSVDIDTFTREFDFTGNRLPGVWGFGGDDEDTLAPFRVAAWRPLPAPPIVGEFNGTDRIAEDDGLITYSVGRFATGLGETRSRVVRWVDGRRVEWE